MTASVPDMLPFEVRVHSLEARVFGLDHSGQPSGSRPSERSVQRRIEDIEEALERAAQGSDALKRLIDGYQQYLPLLSLPDQQPKDKDNEQAIHESDLLPDETKLTMVLEAAGDIRHAERVLRDIELLKKHEAEGSGTLEGKSLVAELSRGRKADNAELLPYRGSLIEGIETVRGKDKDLCRTREEVAELLRRYNDFTSTVSDLFLEVHHRVEIMEEAVARKERKKRKELASRY